MPVPPPGTLPDRFAAAMARLGPWEPAPALAVAVSGGADSMALALLARDWASGRGGSVLALIVDHGLRPEAGQEAATTRDRLAALGIDARVLPIVGLPRGPALAERARAARYAVLREAARAAGLAHLLVGHHALDQIETVMIRVLGGSTNSGLAAMPLVTDDATPRLLRPLLAEDPAALRVFLAGAGVTWVEDPSNRDPNARRARLRHRMGGPDPSRTLLAAVSEAGVRRAANEARVAAILAERALVRPEGFAILSPGPIDPEALSRLVRTIGGERYPPPTAMIARLARSPRPATLAGVQLLPAGRLGPGWLILREAASLAPPVPAARGVVWDRRFRLVDEVPPTLSLGALGADAAAVRHLSPLPAAILRTLPALRCCNLLAVVPHLLYRDPVVGCDVRMVFHPPTPLAGAPFLPP